MIANIGQMLQSSIFHLAGIMLDQELQLVMSFLSQNFFDDFIDSESKILVNQIIDNIFHHFTGEIGIWTFNRSLFGLDSNPRI